MEEDPIKLHKIYFANDVYIRELKADEINALLNLRDQVEMMFEPRNEMPWTEIVVQAKELERTFKELAKALGFKVKK